MWNSRKPQDGLAGLHAEIAEEKAGALGRIAEKLEALLAACERLRSDAEATGAEGADATPAARAKLLAEHERTRAEAKLYYWYLVVQREAVGLYEHGAIARLYPMPPRLS